MDLSIYLLCKQDRVGLLLQYYQLIYFKLFKLDLFSIFFVLQ
uniref:Uncharacterized protein n=1 Tax=Zea mays TaxID=4577 RepID=B4FVW2_MAIZE|nr:unknown [Zea mays]